MRVSFVTTSLYLRSTVISVSLAAAMLLAGCAMGPAPAIGQSASACGMNAVLYCDLSPPVERCQCVRHGDFRDIMGTISLR